MTLLSSGAVTNRSTALLLFVLWALALPAVASEQPATPPPTEEAPLLEEAIPAAVVFPDPVLMQRARTYRTVGATLSIAGAVAFVASFNLTLAALRSGNEAFAAAMPAWSIPGVVLTFVALEFGAPLWSVGGEMYRQLTRNTKGDEKLRRSVANDPRYWQGRTSAAFGTALALTGGIQLMVGTLLLVGTIWVVERADMVEDQTGDTIHPRILLMPIGTIGVGTGMLIAGLELRRQGLERSQSVRDAHAATAVMVVPYFGPDGGGLALAGRF